ncbi:hypothetical protein PRIEUP_LOCUS841, partial [Pristimantis euphronides]
VADPYITIGYQILNFAAEIFFLAGFLINIFIVAVNILELKKGGPMTTADNVITSLGISRMVFQVICLLNIIYFYKLDNLFLVLILLVDMPSIYSSIWLSTLLCVIFCLKIPTLQNGFFL